MIQHCFVCRAPLGIHTPNLFGEPAKCIQCETNDRTKMMLRVLPEPFSDGWDDLTEWEQAFIESVREQFARKKTVSEKQYLILERIWEKC